MSQSGVPISTGENRVWIIEGRARPDHLPSYKYTHKMMALSKAFGDITPLRIPNPNKYDAFDTVRNIRGAEENATTQLVGRYLRNMKSEMLRIALAGCALDLQLHTGACNDPSDFDTFEKVLVLEDASITTWGTEDLGALDTEERAKVDETIDISAANIYEVMPLTFSEKAKTTATNEVIDVTVSDEASCGSCTSESDGCKKIYAVSKAAGGSPSTPADVIFSLDKGAGWAAHDVDSMGATDDPDGIAGVGDYIVVISADTGSMHIAIKNDFENSGDPTFIEVATGFVVGGEPQAIKSVGRTAFIAGKAGYIYKTEDPAAGVTVLEAGTVTISDLNDIDAISEDFAVAVGNDGVILVTSNGLSWGPVAYSPVGVGTHINAVAIKSATEWFIGTSTGVVWYTIDGGATWKQKALAGTTPTAINDIQISTASVMYISGVVSSHGRIWRSINGGNTWIVMPRQGSLPVSDRINSLAVCSYDPDFVVGVGLADNGTDGYVVIGQASES